MGKVAKPEILTIPTPHRAQYVVLKEPLDTQQSWFMLEWGIGGLSLQPSSQTTSCLNPVLEKLSGWSLVNLGLP